MGIDLALAIMTYRNPDALSDCLFTLTRYAPCNFRVVVIDNSETPEDQGVVDRVVEGVGENRIEVVHVGENITIEKGYSRRVNDILLNSQTKFVSWMHDDVTFPPSTEQFWSRLFEVAEDRRVGLVGPSVSNGEGFQNPLRIDLPTIVLTHSIHVPLFLCRRELYQGMGGLAEDMQFADVDFCIRVGKMGKDIVVHRGAYLNHTGGLTWKAFRPGVVEFQNWIRKIADECHNEMIRRHGVKGYANYLSRAHDRASVEIFYGDFDWTVQLKAATTFKIEKWTSTTSPGL